MKRVISFIFFLVLIFIFFILITNKAKSYKQEYTFNDYKVIEQFDKEKGIYSFSINNEYDFSFESKYNKKRRRIEKIDYDNKCMRIKVFNQFSEYICKNEDKYTTIYEEVENEIIDSKNNIDIYKNKEEIYIWNNYGLTNLITGKKYNFLKNESYDNKIYYQYNNYIIFADYDSLRVYNKLFIFNLKTKKIKKIELSTNISFDSYFLGGIDNNVYLYDKTNETEYEINIVKETTKKVSNNNAVKYYNNNWDMVDKKKFKYNDISFINEKNINYVIDNNDLYYYHYNSDKKIKIDEKVKSIIYASGNNVYYLKDTTIYHFDIKNKREKIINYFEWNFNYKNKIFIYD